jgi:hypothetical protein
MSVGTLVGAATQWGGNAIRSLLGKPKRQPDEKILDRAIAANQAEKASMSRADKPDAKAGE